MNKTVELDASDECSRCADEPGLLDDSSVYVDGMMDDYSYDDNSYDDSYYDLTDTIDDGYEGSSMPRASDTIEITDSYIEGSVLFDETEARSDVVIAGHRSPSDIAEEALEENNNDPNNNTDSTQMSLEATPVAAAAKSADEPRAPSPLPGCSKDSILLPDDSPIAELLVEQTRHVLGLVSRIHRDSVFEARLRDQNTPVSELRLWDLLPEADRLEFPANILPKNSKIARKLGAKPVGQLATNSTNQTSTKRGPDEDLCTIGCKRSSSTPDISLSVPMVKPGAIPKVPSSSQIASGPKVVPASAKIRTVPLEKLRTKTAPPKLAEPPCAFSTPKVVENAPKVVKAPAAVGQGAIPKIRAEAPRRENQAKAPTLPLASSTPYNTAGQASGAQGDARNVKFATPVATFSVYQPMETSEAAGGNLINCKQGSARPAPQAQAARCDPQAAADLQTTIRPQRGYAHEEGSIMKRAVAGPQPVNWLGMVPTAHVQAPQNYPAQPALQQPIQRPAQQTTQRAVQQPIQRAVQQPIQLAAQQRITPATQQPIQQLAAQQRITPATQQPIERAVQQPIQRDVQQAIQLAAQQRIQRAIPQAIQLAAQQAIQRAAQQPIQPAAQQQIQPATQQPIRPAAQQAIQLAAQQRIQRAILQSVQPAAQQAIQRATQQQVRPATQQQVRPEGQQPTQAAAQQQTQPTKKVVCMEIYYKLINVFPNVDRDYVKKLCPADWAPGDRDAQLATLVEMILEGGDAVPKIFANDFGDREETDARTSSPDDVYENLLGIFPDADPHFLRDFAEKNATGPDDLKQFVERNLERRDYPTREQYMARLKITEQQRQYTHGFDVKHYLSIIPDPEKYFKDPKRRCKMTTVAFEFLKSHFNKMRVNTISRAYSHYRHNLTLTAEYLEKYGSDLRSRRCGMEMPTEDILLLQEMAYIKHKTEITDFITNAKKTEENEFKMLKAQNLLLECQCCFDAECVPSKCCNCDNGHVFCNECVVNGTNAKLGDGDTHISCFINCGSEFSLSVLQQVLAPTTFSILLKKRQAAEVMEAGVEGLVSCPFCHFASIPPEEDKIFKCLNPECTKESCRLCKELSHVPLKCDEVMKADKARLYIEEKMTAALARTCYKCQKSFFKEEGCNKITCVCGAIMCYLCDQPIKDYSHFRGQGSDDQSRCPLYSDTIRLDAVAVREVAEQAQLEVLKRNPNVKIDTRNLLPAIPRPQRGPHQDILNADELPRRAQRVIDLPPM